MFWMSREDWVETELGKFAFHEKGKKPINQKDKFDSTYKYPYVDIEAFEKGIIKSYTDGEKCNFCTEEDFLMVWDGSRSGLVGKGVNGALGSTLVRINFPGILNNYAFFFLKSKYQQINTRAKGTGTPHVDPSLLWAYNFPIPPLPEQRAIVTKIEQLFSDLDNGIASLKTAQDQLKVYRQAVLKKAFEGELTKEWRAKQTDLPTADELLVQIKEERATHYQKQLDDWDLAVREWEENGKEGRKPGKPRQMKQLPSLIEKIKGIPYGWSLLNLEKICNKISDGPFGSNLKTADYASDGIRIIRLENIKNLFFDDSKKTFISQEKFNIISNHSVYSGDIIFSTFISDETKVAIVPNQITIAINKADCICIRPIEIVSNKFLENYLSTRFVFTNLENQVHGATRPRINTTQLKSVAIPICSSLEQTQIVQEIESRLSVCDKVEETIKESLKKAEALRQSILKKAFEGRLLSEAESVACREEDDWEPAEVLLERIKREKSK